MRSKLLVVLAIVSLLVAACSAAVPVSTTAASSVAVPTTSAIQGTPTATVPGVEPSAVTAGEPVSPLAAKIGPAESALYDPTDHVDEAPAPTSISISRLGVDAAQVVDVGVEENGDMELPGADAVGWYRFNAKPGQSGSSVLAAHIAYNGRPGVFRYLSDIEVGDRVEIEFEDGSQSAFEIVEVAQYDKNELPIERVFAKDGDPILTLITCGGDFNRSLRSYADNFVAYAVPVEG